MIIVIAFKVDIIMSLGFREIKRIHWSIKFSQNKEEVNSLDKSKEKLIAKKYLNLMKNLNQ